MKAIDYIRKGWTQGQYARDKNGISVYSDDFEKAVCWCAIGALMAAYSIDGFCTREYEPALEKLRKLVGTCILFWNDNPQRTQAEVIEVFTRAGI
jgi:hypothetical protein